VTIIPPPGVEGGEVAFQLPLPVGSNFTVTKVYRSSELFNPPRSLGVTLDGAVVPADLPVRIDLMRGNEGAGRVALNPAIYLRIRSYAPTSSQ
jgi:hypothetical protein